MPNSTTVESDQFDQTDTEQMLAVSPRLRDAFDGLAEATPTGEGLGPDLMASLLRIAPRKHDTIPPRLRLNETIIDQTWKAEQYRDLHEHTMGDPINASAGVVALARKVNGMLEGMGDVAEQAQRAQAAQDALEAAMAGEGDSGGEPGGEGEGGESDDVESLRSDAEVQSELLEGMIDDRLPKIDQAVRAGIEEAAAEAEAQAAAAAGWSLAPEEAARMDPADRIRLMQTLSSERMREIADLVGIMENMALGNRDRRYKLRPGEITGVTLGSSLARLIPAEMVALAVPELEDLLVLRLIKGRARNYLTEAIERAGRGAVLYLEDQSGSMSGLKGKWSKAFGLALLRVARDQGRAFHAFCFQGEGVWERFDFPNPRAAVTELMVEFASTAPTGGTEITGPLDEAVALLQAEYDKGGNIEGDIVLATDGEVGVPDAWLAAFTEKRDQLDFHVYGLAIKARLSTLHKLCTHVADVTDLTSGRDVADVFATVN